MTAPPQQPPAFRHGGVGVAGLVAGDFTELDGEQEGVLAAAGRVVARKAFARASPAAEGASACSRYVRISLLEALQKLRPPFG